MSTHGIVVTGWIIIAGALAAVQLVGLVGKSRVQGIGRVAGALAHPRSGKVVLLLGWGWLGWHLFVR